MNEKVWLTDKGYASVAIAIRDKKIFWVNDGLYEYEWKKIKEFLEDYTGEPVSVLVCDEAIEYIFDTAEQAVRWVEENCFSGI